MKKLRSLNICTLMFLATACGEPVQKVSDAVDGQSANPMDGSAIAEVHEENQQK